MKTSSSVPVTTRRVLVDSSAYFAMTDPRDVNHRSVLVARERLINQRWTLYTTNFLLAETHALLLARLGRHVAARVIREIDRSTTTVIRATRADEVRALEIIDHFDDKDFSFTDTVSFAVMERMNIRHALTFDRHFAQYGFRLFTADHS